MLSILCVGYSPAQHGPYCTRVDNPGGEVFSSIINVNTPTSTLFDGTITPPPPFAGSYVARYVFFNNDMSTNKRLEIEATTAAEACVFIVAFYPISDTVIDSAYLFGSSTPMTLSVDQCIYGKYTIEVQYSSAFPPSASDHIKIDVINN